MVIFGKDNLFGIDRGIFLPFFKPVMRHPDKHAEISYLCFASKARQWN